MLLVFLVGAVLAIVAFIQIGSLSRRITALEEHLRQQTESRPCVGVEGAQVVAATTTSTAGVAAAHPELIAFIKEQWQRGVDERTIAAALRARGWQAATVTDALQVAGLSTTFRPVSSVSGTSSADAFFAWCKEDWLLKIGAGLMIIALGWFVTYAFMNNWIGPFGRIMCGLLAGAAFLALGGWRIRTHGHQGGIFLVVGSTTVLLTVFAAQALRYPVFTPETAMGTMFLSTLVVAIMSVRYNRPVLAHSSLLLASLVPFLTVPEEASVVGLFTYLMVITVGSILIVLLTGHRGLLVTSLAVTTVYSLPFLYDGGDPDAPVLLMYAFAFAAMYFLIQMTALLRQPTLRTADLIMAPGIGLLVILWILAVVPTEWQSLLLSAWILVFATGAFVIARRLQLPVLMYLYAAIGLVLLATATAIELSGVALVIAFTFEVAAVVLGAWWLWGDMRVVQTVVWLFTLPILLSLPYLDSYHWEYGIMPFNEVTVLACLAGVLVLTGCYFLLVARRTHESVAETVGGALAIIGSVFVYILLWRILHVIFLDDTAVTVALAIYTITGITAYLSGHRSNVVALRWYGGLLIAVVVGRLLLVDVWEMAIVGRIITFGIVGLLLMSTAFMAKKKKL